MKNKLTYLIILLAFISISCSKTEKAPTTAEDALQHYLDNGDKTYKWEKTGSFDFTEGGGKGYDLLLTSQKWREFTWKHQLTVLVPEVASSAAFSFLSLQPKTRVVMKAVINRFFIFVFVI